jgi:2'-5' RNA ligase
MRTFVCIELTDEIRQKLSLLSGTLSLSGANVKWVEPHNVHLTLKFLGEVPDKEIPDVCKEIKRVAAGIPPFDFAVEGLGTFPPGRNPRVVWCGVKEESGALEKLQRELSTALRDYAAKEEHKKFTAHLTIGRVRGGGVEKLCAEIERNRKAGLGSQDASEVVLMMSALSPQGPTYTPLGRFALNGRR